MVKKNNPPHPKQKITWRDVTRWCVYLLLILAVLGLGWFAIPASVNYTLTEKYIFMSQQDAAITLGVLVPKSGPYQTVRSLNVSWNGTREDTSHPFLDVIRLTGAIEAGDVQEATITYAVNIRQGAARWDAPVEEFQLQPQANIESDNQTLMEQAARVASGQTRKDAYAIYAFTASHLSWPKGTRINMEPSALAAYTSREGGCEEFAYLAVALLRASRIPAQAISGLALPAYPPFWSATRTWNSPAGAHAWVELQTEAGWELADPSWGSSWPGPLKWLWFGRNDGSHLSYGESREYARVYDGLMAWGEQQGSIIAAMSAPLHFVAAADLEGVSLTPSITVHKGWDGRWGVEAGLYILLLVGLRLIENASKRRRQEH
jgi:hypothetical protein